MAKDPICGMAVDPEQSIYKIQGVEQTYYFCSETCKEKYLNLKSSHSKKSWFKRFLEWIARANQKKFGSSPPSCCGHDQ